MPSRGLSLLRAVGREKNQRQKRHPVVFHLASPLSPGRQQELQGPLVTFLGSLAPTASATAATAATATAATAALLVLLPLPLLSILLLGAVEGIAMGMAMGMIPQTGKRGPHINMLLRRWSQLLAFHDSLHNLVVLHSIARLGSPCRRVANPRHRHRYGTSLPRGFG
jgi:hypothetical protein